MSDTSRTLSLAIGLGAVAGLRSMTAPAFLSRHLARHRSGVAGMGRVLAMRPVPALSAAAAAGEMAADKTPFVPDRTDPVPLMGRVGMGVLMGVAVAGRRGGSGVAAGLAGGAAALAATFGGYHLRRAASEAGLPDAAAAVAEDAVAIVAAALISDAVG